MALLVQRILTAALSELEDDEPGHEYTRWSKPDMLGYVTEAMAALHFYKPDLFVERMDVTLRPGDTQRVPATVSKIISLDCNVEPNGRDGRPIYPSKHELIKALYRPSQFDPMATYRVRSCAVDPENPQLFYVNPPAPEYPVARARGMFLMAPPEITNEGQQLTLPAADAAGWFNAILDYTLFRAFAKDTESNTSRTKSRDHEIAFMNAVGAKTRLDRLQEGEDE
jgi:hypothetical protein